MAINEQASRDATSKAPVLVYSVTQDGWPASSTIAPPPPPRLAAAALMPQPPPPPRLATAAARSRCAHAATAATVVAAAAAAAPAARAGCSVRCGTKVCIGVAKRIKGLPVCGPRQPSSIKAGMGSRWGRASRPLGAAEALGERFSGIRRAWPAATSSIITELPGGLSRELACVRPAIVGPEAAKSGRQPSVPHGGVVNRRRSSC